MSGREISLRLMDENELHRTEVRIGLEGFCGVGDQDYDVWFPEIDWPKHPDVQQQSLNEAAQQCAGCPVRKACATAALTRREQYGIWGGLPGWALYKIRRARGSKLREVLVELGAEWLMPRKVATSVHGKNTTRTVSSSGLAA